MKIPSVGKTESVLLLVGLAIGAYLIYRVGSAGGTITQGVKDSIAKVGDIIKSGVDAVDVGATSAGSVFRSAVNGGDAPTDPNDQSEAETARLKRDEQSIIVNSPAQSGDPAFQNFDPVGFGMGTQIGMADNAQWQALAQNDSPDATGRATSDFQLG